MQNPVMNTPTWYGSKCADDSEKDANLGWGQEVKQIGKRTGTEAAGKEKCEKIEEDGERKMAAFGVAKYGQKEEEEGGASERETGEESPGYGETDVCRERGGEREGGRGRGRGEAG